MEEVIEVITLVRFAVADATGDILWIGQCPEEELPLQAYEPEHVVIANVPKMVADDTHYYKDGFVQYPPRPGSWAVFDHVAEQWVDTRSNNRDDDFDLNDYSIDAVISVDENILSWSPFVASRNNGIYVDAKTVTPGSIAYTGNSTLVGFDWDTNAIMSFENYASFYSHPRRLLIGEFRGSGAFISATNLINGERVGAGTVSTRQIAPASCSEIMTVYSEVETKTAPKPDNPDEMYLAMLRTRIDVTLDVEEDDVTVMLILNGFNQILGDLRPYREQIHSLSYDITVDGAFFGSFGIKDPTKSEDLSMVTNIHAIPFTRNMSTISVVCDTGRLYAATIWVVKR